MSSHAVPLAAATRISPRVPVRWSGKALLGILILAGVLGFPMFLLITTAFNVGDPQEFPATEFGFDNFIALLDHLDWIGNTLLVAALSTALGLVFALILAWTLYRAALPGQRIFEALIALPYPLGPLVGALSWYTLGQPGSGLLNQLVKALTGFGPIIDVSSVGGIVFVMAVFEAPVAVLMIGAAMQRMDPSLEESSSVFGAGLVRTGWRVTLPLMLPAICSAALFLFTSTMGSFAIPAILGARSRFYVATMAIWVSFQGYPPNYPQAAAIGLVLIAITAFAVWLTTVVLRGRSHAVISGRSYRPRRVVVGRWAPLLIGVECLYVLVAVVLPLGALLVTSLQSTDTIVWNPLAWTLGNYRLVIFDLDITRRALTDSLLLGVGTGTVGVVCATLLAWVVHRSRGRGRQLLEQATMLPQSFPPLIFGFSFLWMVLVLPLPLYGTLFAVLAAYVVIFLPLGYRSMSGVIVQIDRSLEESARINGAGWGRMMRTVTVPLLRVGLVSTWTLLFMVSIREVSTSLFLSSADTPVLGPAILNYWESGGLPRVSALVMVQAIIILIAYGAVRATGSREVKL